MLPRSIQLLLRHVIDYAGVFPPARLELGEAVRNFMLYKSEPCAWMIGQFVCPVSLLKELATYDEWFADGLGEVFVSATGRGGQTADEWLTNFEADLITIEAFNAGTKAEQVTSYEVKVPKGLINSGQLSPILHQARAAAGDIDLFYELPILEMSETSLTNTIKAIRDVHKCSLKFRTGGPDADAFPNAHTLAVAIARARDADLAFKATAGLHRPLPTDDHEIRVRMHGFINLLCAGVLAKSNNLDVTSIEQVLNIQDAKSFVFDEEGLEVAGQRASPADISAGRCFMLSFGSCSVVEPIEGLGELGYDISLL